MSSALQCRAAKSRCSVCCNKTRCSVCSKCCKSRSSLLECRLDPDSACEAHGNGHNGSEALVLAPKPKADKRVLPVLPGKQSSKSEQRKLRRIAEEKALALQRKEVRKLPRNAHACRATRLTSFHPVGVERDSLPFL